MDATAAQNPYSQYAGNEERASLKAKFANDRHRPIYHFLPPSSWLNDPNGVIQWNGYYHLFYQCATKSPEWDPKLWGHAVSTDLVHWTDLPVALEPTPGTADASGIWSGVVVDNGGVPVAIYTGKNGRTELPCAAIGDENLISWQKYEGNPLMPEPPELVATWDFRDHIVWKEGDTWYMGMGTTVKGGGGAVLLFSSPDLFTWKYEHPLYQGDAGVDREVYECPSFFPLGDKHVLIFSSTSRSYPVAYLGTYTADRDVCAESEERMDFGGKCMYAPQTFEDVQGRRISWGWLRENRTWDEFTEAGWSGLMGLPIVMTLKDGLVCYDFAKETEALRGANIEFGSQSVSGDEIHENLEGDALEIDAEFLPGTATSFGLILRSTPDGSEQVRLSYSFEKGEFNLDVSRSEIGGADSEACPKPAAFNPTPDQPMRFHVYLDRSVIEVVVNDCIYLSARTYPTQDNALSNGVFAEGGEATLTKLNAWKIDSIWD